MDSAKLGLHVINLKRTKAFLAELSSVTGIPVTGLWGLVQTKQGGVQGEQGTWVHPQVAIHLAQWLSPKFAVRVSQWVFNWMTTGGERKNNKLQQDNRSHLKLNDILHAVNPLQKTVIEITHTEQGELVSIDKLRQQAEPVVSNEISTMPSKPLWIRVVEMFFDEIDREGIPESMRQNMLIAKEMVSLPTGKREQHTCLFFRVSNMMVFLRKNPRFFDLMSEGNISTSQALLAFLENSGVMVFTGKTKEKGIPIDPNTPSEMRRVPHLVAIDLVILEQDYGVVMSNSQGIAKILR